MTQSDDDDALLASAFRKVLRDRENYVSAGPGDSLRIDGYWGTGEVYGAMLTDEEFAAIRRAAHPPTPHV